MDNDQLNRIEELLTIIPTRMCRNMEHKFLTVILKDVSDGLAKHNFMILKMLQENEKLYVTEIVHSLGITKSQMTASVDKLLKLGLVERRVDTIDRRRIFVSLTEEGLRITVIITDKIKDVFREDIKVLSQRELDDLEKGLEVLIKFCSSSEQ